MCPEKGVSTVYQNDETTAALNASYPTSRPSSQRDFPYYRQKDMVKTSDGLTNGGQAEGICGRDIHISDNMKPSDVSSNEGTKKLMKQIQSDKSQKKLFPRWIRSNGKIILDDPAGLVIADVDLTFIIAHEIGHALGLDHGNTNMNNLMFETPNSSNTKKFQKFFDRNQMTAVKCKNLKKGMDNIEAYLAKFLFYGNQKRLKQHI